MGFADRPKFSGSKDRQQERNILKKKEKNETDKR